MKDKQRSTLPMKDKHTPGPWKVVRSGEIESADCTPIADVAVLVQWNTTGGIKEEDMPWEANARLIAAAPELLDALKALMDAHASHEFPVLMEARGKAKELIERLTEQ